MYLRPTIGAHKSAWEEAVQALGIVQAAVTLIYVLQLHTDDVAAGTNRIRNPGGYFRALVRLIADRKFKLTAELMALRRKRMT
jgi:replication initiation protein RepC